MIKIITFFIAGQYLLVVQIKGLEVASYNVNPLMSLDAFKGSLIELHADSTLAISN